MKPIILLILLILGIVFISNAESYYVTQTAYVRAGKGIRYKTIGIVHKGATVEVVEISGSWAKITNNEQYGFINKQFLHKGSNSANKDRGSPNYLGYAVLIVIAIAAVNGFFKMGSSGGSYRSSSGNSPSPSQKPYNPLPVNERIQRNLDIQSGKRKLLE